MMVKSRFNPEEKRVEVSVLGMVPTCCFELASLIREMRETIVEELGWEEANEYMEHTMQMSYMDDGEMEEAHSRLMLDYLKGKLERGERNG